MPAGSWHISGIKNLVCDMNTIQWPHHVGHRESLRLTRSSSWLNAPQRRLQCRTPKATREETFGSSLRLPNGLVLRHFTSDEFNFLYREVHQDRVYLRHGVTLRPGDTVVDVGANTGLFTLLAAEAVGPAGRCVALEPLPRTFQLLQENVAAHAAWCAERGVQTCPPVLLNCGAGAPDQISATFTSYSDSASGWSTMYPDDEEVGANMRTYIDHLLHGEGEGEEGLQGKEREKLQGTPGASAEEEKVEGLDSGSGGGGRVPSGGGDTSEVPPPAAAPEPLLARAGRTLWRALPPARPVLRAAASAYVSRVMLAGQRRWRCPLLPLSRVFREHGLERVNLLKIDVERAEMDVLSGLAPADWARVQQVVLEVHDAGGRLGAVRELLAGAGGFPRVVCEQGRGLEGTNLVMVYGMR